jgi:tRNA 2-thiocytidine biosynthesis protein TtcA
MDYCFLTFQVIKVIIDSNLFSLQKKYKKNMDIPVAQHPWSGLGKKLESTIRKALFDYRMLDEVKDLAIALSGGKDSLSLLFFLKAISGRGFPPFNLHAINVSGEFSCGAGVNLDELRRLCDKLHVNFITRESHQKLESLECYSCSRERRSLIFDAAKSVSAQTIAFGHHRDDQAETVLMNLLHKGEFAGLLPKIHMQEYGVTIIRPLIYVAETDIKTFAQQQGFSRIVCRCPVGQTSMRSKVDTLIDEIEYLYPNARENIAKAGLIYGSDKASRP